MRPEIVRGKIAAPAEHVLPLADPHGIQIHSSSHCIARTLRTADKPHLNPVMMIDVHVAKQYRHAVHVVDHDADLAVVKDVTERRPSSHAYHCEACSFHSGHQVEFSI